MYGMLWPKPTGRVELSDDLIHLLPGDVSLVFVGTHDQTVQRLLEELKAVFKEYLYMMHPKYHKGSGKTPNLQILMLLFNFSLAQSVNLPVFQVQGKILSQPLNLPMLQS